jgi:chemotaxis protein methyltransferase CheR
MMASAKADTEAVIAAAVNAVNAAVVAHTGIVLGAPRQADLKASLGKVMAAAGAADPLHWPMLLETNPALFDQVVAGITIGETYFFRDPDHFAYVREVVLPEVHRRRPGQDVQVWSAGCSTGEEPYSLAIMFDEARIGARILATDISRPSLAKAAQGIYGRWALRGEGVRLIGSYLRPVAHARGEKFELIERMRSAVRFAYLNLAHGSDTPLVPPGSMDVIFCRNVLIYLDAKTIARVGRQFYDVLADGGALVTGPSDPLLGDAAPFTIEGTSAGVVYRKGIQIAQSAAPLSIEPAFLEDEEPFTDMAPPAPAPVESRNDEQAAIQSIRACANGGDLTDAAVRAAAAALAYPKSREIPYLHAIMLMNLNRLPEADVILKRLIYLDPTLAVVHFTLGNLRLRRGDLAGARRAFKAAQTAAADRPAAEILALSEGETAGHLAAAAARLAAGADEQRRVAR